MDEKEEMRRVLEHALKLVKEGRNVVHAVVQAELAIFGVRSSYCFPRHEDWVKNYRIIAFFGNNVQSLRKAEAQRGKTWLLRMFEERLAKL